jgi:hypothetical protein
VINQSPVKSIGTAKVGKVRVKKNATKKSAIRRKGIFPLHKEAEATRGRVPVGQFFNKEGRVIIDVVARSFGMSRVNVHDPSGRLPKDQLSWR